MVSRAFGNLPQRLMSPCCTQIAHAVHGGARHAQRQHPTELGMLTAEERLSPDRLAICTAALSVWTFPEITEYPRESPDGVT
jgi:hypothetical protein